jgi:hypothetical protein
METIAVDVAASREAEALPEIGSGKAFRAGQKFPRRCYHQRKLCTLPWIRCLHCGVKLARYDVVERQTCIRVGKGFAMKLTIVCTCGAVRTFHSHSI